MEDPLPLYTVPPQIQHFPAMAAMKRWQVLLVLAREILSELPK
jgi:hypothetical protein